MHTVNKRSYLKTAAPRRGWWHFSDPEPVILNTLGVGSLCDNIAGWFKFPEGHPGAWAFFFFFLKGQVTVSFFKSNLFRIESSTLLPSPCFCFHTFLLPFPSMCGESFRKRRSVLCSNFPRPQPPQPRAAASDTQPSEQSNKLLGLVSGEDWMIHLWSPWDLALKPMQSAVMRTYWRRLCVCALRAETEPKRIRFPLGKVWFDRAQNASPMHYG